MKFRIPLYLYVEARNAEMAAGVAERSSFVATQALRLAGSGMIEDKTTITQVSGAPELVQEIPKQSYQKGPLIKAFGEDLAIRILNADSDRIHR